MCPRGEWTTHLQKGFGEIMNYKRKTLVVALSLIGSMTAAAAYADDSDASLQRVDVIGSHIKRLKDEKATELTTVKVDDLAKQGLTTVEQVVNALSSNQSNIGANSSVGQSTGGAAFANLRGLGQQYTLVLLDGRRIAYHPFDGTAADLNSIPLSSIERVEVLPDGAAAIYGSDAVGGVINFVTKKSVQGLTLGGDFLTPQRSGGNEKNLDGSYGYGSLAKDGFNVYATVNYHKTDPVMANQRAFASAILPTTKPSVNSYPGNYSIDGGNTLIGPSSYPNCYGATAKGGYCVMYPSSMVGIQPETEQISGLAKGTLRIGDNHELSVTYNITRTKTNSLSAPTPTFGDVQLPSGTQGINSGSNPILPALRTIPLGDRNTEAVSTTQKLQVNLEGLVAGWDYRTGVGYSQSYATEELVSGFTGINELTNAYLNNQISLTTGMATDPSVWSKIGLTGHLDDGKYTSVGADFSLSKEIYQLPAGMLAVAFGGETRHDTLTHNFNYPISTDALGPGMTLSKNTQGNRTVDALFGEADIPIVKNLDGKVAVRYDHYNDVGDTVNPQVSLRYEMTPQVLFRSSASTGFRAPSLYDMYTPNQEQLTGNNYANPLTCPSMSSSCTQIQRYMMTGGNTHLKPEKSSSLSFGMVIQPTKSITASADFWWVTIKDQIGTLPEATLFTPQYANLLSYDSNGNLVGQATTMNMGNSSSAGVDLDFHWTLPKTNYGNFGIELAGTYLAKSDYQIVANGQYYSNLGQYPTTLNEPTFRWQHTLTFNWSLGPWSSVLSESYKSGYTDQHLNPDGSQHFVKPYSTWNLSGSYEWNKHLTLTAGVRNLFDQLPPYSNQTYLFQANYDARFADQVGRAYFLKANYKM
ncbi:TonB-dependent receptor [Chromobacterium subtsugae]|uniref:TonB-dependent receptor n=4 Tax=Chromobacteriaceae TaxID=1499392 RepID=A0ABS7FI10_9NEIS|nr:TonB-dependent receptor [Chromobacterium subtsugae]MBW8289709.1 TonB-dependent receptor [Chromobacterium subtsugae]